MVSFPPVSPPRPFTHPSPHPYAPHAQPISFFTLLGEEYKSFSSSLCNPLHSPVTSSLLGPYIFLNTMFSNTLSFLSSRNIYYTIVPILGNQVSDVCYRAISWDRCSLIGLLVVMSLVVVLVLLLFRFLTVTINILIHAKHNTIISAHSNLCLSHVSVIRQRQNTRWFKYDRD